MKYKNKYLHLKKKKYLLQDGGDPTFRDIDLSALQVYLKSRESELVAIDVHNYMEGIKNAYEGHTRESIAAQLKSKNIDNLKENKIPVITTEDEKFFICTWALCCDVTDYKTVRTSDGKHDRRFANELTGIHNLRLRLDYRDNTNNVEACAHECLMLKNNDIYEDQTGNMFLIGGEMLIYKKLDVMHVQISDESGRNPHINKIKNNRDIFLYILKHIGDIVLNLYDDDKLKVLYINNRIDNKSDKYIYIDNHLYQSIESFNNREIEIDDYIPWLDQNDQHGHFDTVDVNEKLRKIEERAYAKAEARASRGSKTSRGYDNDNCLENNHLGDEIKPFQRNPICTHGNNGYNTISLKTYMEERNIAQQKINGIDCIVGYRGQDMSQYGKNIADPTLTPLYKTRMNDWFTNPDSKLINFAMRPPNYNDAWGNEPSIGINLVTNINMAQIYGAGKNQDEHYYSIFKVYIEIENTQIVVINEECKWSQITCDEYTNTNFHLIGHEKMRHPEFNILDKGRARIVYILSQKYNKFGDALMEQQVVYDRNTTVLVED